jgi:hypothetical protein
MPNDESRDATESRGASSTFVSIWVIVVSFDKDFPETTIALPKNEAIKSLLE